eukprot:8159-Heterococcus_DN1.PRE.2
MQIVLDQYCSIVVWNNRHVSMQCSKDVSLSNQQQAHSPATVHHALFCHTPGSSSNTLNIVIRCASRTQGRVR